MLTLLSRARMKKQKNTIGYVRHHKLAQEDMEARGSTALKNIRINLITMGYCAGNRIFDWKPMDRRVHYIGMYIAFCPKCHGPCPTPTQFLFCVACCYISCRVLLLFYFIFLFDAGFAWDDHVYSKHENLDLLRICVRHRINWTVITHHPYSRSSTTSFPQVAYCMHMFYM